MSWYSAHIIQYFKLRDEPQSSYTTYENIVLSQADSTDEAFAKAETIGREEYEYSGDLRLGDKPAISVFGGIREIVECRDNELRPGDGTELTWIEFELGSEEALQQLINGDSVTVVHE